MHARAADALCRYGRRRDVAEYRLPQRGVDDCMNNAVHAAETSVEALREACLIRVLSARGGDIDRPRCAAVVTQEVRLRPVDRPATRPAHYK